MADDSQKSQFDPSEHTVEEVVEYLNDADSDEVERVQKAEADGKDRKGVADFESESEDKDEDKDKKTDQAEKAANADPDPEAGEEAVKENAESNADADSDDYNPFTDPDVPSSVVAQIVADELKGLGESPTLEGLKEAKKDAEDK